MNQSRCRPVQHLKMTVWSSVFLKIDIQKAKEWPERVLQQSFISIFHFWSEYSNFIYNLDNSSNFIGLLRIFELYAPACLFRNFSHFIFPFLKIGLSVSVKPNLFFQPIDRIWRSEKYLKSDNMPRKKAIAIVRGP